MTKKEYYNNKMCKHVLIFTELPFRIQGNQSLLRFTKMFLEHNIQVTLCTSGQDDLGTRAIEHQLLTLHFFPKIFEFLKKRIVTNSAAFKNKELSSHKKNHFLSMRSDEKIPPFGANTFKTALRKWVAFIIMLIENIFLFIYALIFLRDELNKSQIIIGYECSYAFASKWLACIWKRKYINKYQGTVLAATNRNMIEAKLYYPYFLYGINQSDLCLMVNDGTDGKYYANFRGCKNIFFSPHGVGAEDYETPSSIPDIFIQHSKKIILFNNASRSRWKRVDRIIRALSLLPEEFLTKIHLFTTYHADDKDELVEYTNSLGLEKVVTFLTGLNHIESNKFIQHSDLVVMTNEMSNLGNPVLEAIYYGTPVLSLNDGSLDGFVTHNVDGCLINVSPNMDQDMADILTRMITEEGFLPRLKFELRKNKSVNSLKTQQEIEFKKIEFFLNG